MPVKGTWVTTGYRPGDLLIFDFGKGIAHIGICDHVNPDGTIVTVEGNTGIRSDDNGGAVMERLRYARQVRGACRPAYTAKMTAAKVLAIARAEIGVKESPAGSNNVKYNTEYYGRPVTGAFAWCVVFIWWVFMKAGMSELFYGGAKTASCTTLARYYGYGRPSIPTSLLKFGSKGPDVVILQKRLEALGFSCGGLDGDFGTKTQNAVKKFQTAKKLEPDGEVGPLTWKALYN